MTAVTVVRPPVPLPDASWPLPVVPQDRRRLAAIEQAHVLAEAADALDLDIRCEVVDGDPAATLCQRAALPTCSS